MPASPVHLLPSSPPFPSCRDSSCASPLQMIHELLLAVKVHVAYLAVYPSSVGIVDGNVWIDGIIRSNGHLDAIRVTI